MQQNKLYLVIGVLIAAVVVLGAYLWHEKSKPEGVEIKVDQNGISVEGN